MKLTIVIERTANTTPERSWDYMAWFEGYEEDGPRATGDSAASALVTLICMNGDCQAEEEMMDKILGEYHE